MFCITARTSDLVQSKPVNRGPWKVAVTMGLRKRSLTVGKGSKIFFSFFKISLGKWIYLTTLDDHKCIQRYHLLKNKN